MHRSHVVGNPLRFIGAVPAVRRGSLLLEAVLSIAVFAIFLAGIGLSLFVGQESTISGADRVRAVFLAEEALEGARHLRDDDFANLTPGTHGITVGSDGLWALTSQPVTTDGYTTTLTLTSHSETWIEATAEVTWDFGRAHSGSVLLSTYLTNWKVVAQSGNWSSLHPIASFSGGTAAHFNHILVQGNYAYVTGDISAGGKGLYVFDISNPASPQQIASSFDLLASGYDMTIQGNHLIIATDSTSSEIQVFDISSPASLTTSHLSGSIDLPGSGLARTIDSFNGVIFTGGNQNLTDNELFSLYLSSTGALSLLGSLNIDANISDINLRDGYAYLATSQDNAELQVADVFDPEVLTFVPGTGLDLTDVYDGKITHTFGTSALIGRMNGTTISELTLYSIADSPLPVTPPGPWTLEVGGDANTLETDPTGTYGFLGSSLSTGELKVLQMSLFSSGGNPVLLTYDAPATITSLAYDWVSDRLFIVTATNLFVFAPGP